MPKPRPSYGVILKTRSRKARSNLFHTKFGVDWLKLPKHCKRSRKQVERKSSFILRSKGSEISQLVSDFVSMIYIINLRWAYFRALMARLWRLRCKMSGVIPPPHEKFTQRLVRIVSIGIRNVGKVFRPSTLQFVTGYKMTRK